MSGLAEFELIPRRRLHGRQGSVRTERIRRAGRQCLEVNDPGIPGRNNWWCPSQGQARITALAHARALGLNHRIVHDRRPIRGWPHYHVVAPEGDRVSGHYFYGGRPPRRVFRDRPWREFEYESEQEPAPAGGRDHFVVQVRVPVLGTVIVPEGHEILTRRAASGLFTSPQVAALVEGVRRVDTVPPWEHFLPDSQKRHALRRDLCTRMGAALSEIRNHLVLLHSNALSSAGITAFGWIGEALHLIQDSFSEAHTERLWSAAGSPPHRINFIRYFGPRGRPAPDEHQVVPSPDPRDIITTASGSLTRAATHSVVASKEFLKMMRRHLASPGAAGISAELRAFMDRHLILSARPREPRSLYPSCP